MKDIKWNLPEKLVAVKSHNDGKFRDDWQILGTSGLIDVKKKSSIESARRQFQSSEYNSFTNSSAVFNPTEYLVDNEFTLEPTDNYSTMANNTQYIGIVCKLSNKDVSIHTLVEVRSLMRVMVSPRFKIGETVLKVTKGDGCTGVVFEDEAVNVIENIVKIPKTTVYKVGNMYRGAGNMVYLGALYCWFDVDKIYFRSTTRNRVNFENVLEITDTPTKVQLFIDEYRLKGFSSIKDIVLALEDGKMLAGRYTGSFNAIDMFEGGVYKSRSPKEDLGPRLDPSDAEEMLRRAIKAAHENLVDKDCNTVRHTYMNMSNFNVLGYTVDPVKPTFTGQQKTEIARFYIAEQGINYGDYEGTVHGTGRIKSRY